MPRRAAKLLHRDRAARRTGQDEAHRLLGGHGRAADAAVGLHDQQARRHRMLLQPSFQLREVAAHRRHEERVQHGGGEALILAQLRAHLAGKRYVQRRVGLEQDLAQAPLVRAIGVGMQQAYRHRLDAERHDAPGQRPRLAFVQRRQQPPVERGALGDAETPVARQEERALLGAQAVDVAAHVAPDLQHVLEAAGGDKRAIRKAPLQHRVGGDGGAVHHQLHFRGRGAERARRAGDAFDQPDRGILRRGRDLVLAAPAVALIQYLHVGEGAADVDCRAHPGLPRAHASFRS